MKGSRAGGGGGKVGNSHCPKRILGVLGTNAVLNAADERQNMAYTLGLHANLVQKNLHETFKTLTCTS